MRRAKINDGLDNFAVEVNIINSMSKRQLSLEVTNHCLAKNSFESFGLGLMVSLPGFQLAGHTSPC